MKKEIILTVRVDEKMRSAINMLSKNDDRSTAWMIRALLEEALQARGILKSEEKRLKGPSQ